MPRDYKNIKKNTEKKEPKRGGFLNFLTGLSIGLFVAVLVFFFRDEVAIQLGIESPPATLASAEEPVKQAEEKGKNEQLPKPTFEFYNILPNREVDVSALVTRPADTEEPPEVQEEGNYILQVGSFKQYSAADQVKAKLALLGFQAYIEPGVINGEGVFRVRIGPYSNLTNLKSARERLLANDLDFMQMRL